MLKYDKPTLTLKARKWPLSPRLADDDDDVDAVVAFALPAVLPDDLFEPNGAPSCSPALLDDDPLGDDDDDVDDVVGVALGG